MNETPELTGRVALVTGSASGIGRSAAQRLGSLGATLALVDLDEEGLQLVSSELTSAGRSVSVHTADLADLDGVPSIVDAVMECHARVDILVNAAGVYQKGSLLDTSMAAWELVHRVNLAAPFLLMQAVAARLIEQASGDRILNVSSSSAVRAESDRVCVFEGRTACFDAHRGGAARLARHKCQRGGTRSDGDTYGGCRHDGRSHRHRATHREGPHGQPSPTYLNPGRRRSGDRVLVHRGKPPDHGPDDPHERGRGGLGEPGAHSSLEPPTSWTRRRKDLLEERLDPAPDCLSDGPDLIERPDRPGLRGPSPRSAFLVPMDRHHRTPWSPRRRPLPRTRRSRAWGTPWRCRSRPRPWP